MPLSAQPVQWHWIKYLNPSGQQSRMKILLQHRVSSSRRRRHCDSVVLVYNINGSWSLNFDQNEEIKSSAPRQRAGIHPKNILLFFPLPSSSGVPLFRAWAKALIKSHVFNCFQENQLNSLLFIFIFSCEGAALEVPFVLVTQFKLAISLQYNHA